MEAQEMTLPQSWKAAPAQSRQIEANEFFQERAAHLGFESSHSYLPSATTPCLHWVRCDTLKT